jgi:hypothetical protein
VAAYTCKGVARSGGGQAGAMDIAPADLPAWVEARYRQGWRHLVFTAADDGREAARIGPGDDGGRTWCAERA